MTPDQKFDFLNEWCQNLSRAVRLLEDQDNSLHARLRVVEAACGRMDEFLRKQQPTP